ncbi:uncharacterized protein TNCT_425621, partial [Trichonephila clavata]
PNLDADNKFKTTWESSFASSEAKLTMEDSREDFKQNKHNARSAAWLGLKGLIFVTCVTCFFYQSVQFYMQYSTYPTKTRIRVHIPKMVKNPAVTFCDRNPVLRSEFCARYPNFCEKPNDMNKFCQYEPHFCKGNVSNLTIPKFGYFTQNKREEVEKVAWKLLVNSSGERSPVFKKDDTYLEKITFVYDEELKTIIKCISSNLHIGGKSEPVIHPLRAPKGLHYVNEFTLNLEAEELFYPWLTHQVFFAIHSPLDPINPLHEGRAVKPGYHYSINIRLVEERFLPHPYQTNCTDYEAVWRRNNKTGPRSQKMCRDICRKIYSKACCRCENYLTMFEDIETLCSPVERKGYPYCYCKHWSALLNHMTECSTNCKEECLKVKYLSTIKESVYEPTPSEAIEWTSRRRESTVVSVVIRDLEKTIVYHDPLYSHCIVVMNCNGGVPNGHGALIGFE